MSNNPQDAVAYVASDYNTGWMNGDIKLATLSDTDDTNVTGSELVTNGDFTTDASNWTALSGATLSSSSGKLRVANGSANYGKAEQAITTISGKKYVLSLDSFSGTTSDEAQIRIGTSSSGTLFTIYNRCTNRQLWFYFYCRQVQLLILM